MAATVTTRMASPAGALRNLSPLTPRETEVLKLMADGLSTKEIAAELKVTFKTAATHRNHVIEKVGAKSTVLAVRWAIRAGIVEA